MRKRQLCVASMVLSTALVLGACGSKNTVDNTNEPSQSSETIIVAENDSKNEMEITEPTEEIKKDPDGSEDNSSESTKPSESESTKPSENVNSESSSSEDNSSESKPSESKPSEDNSSESKPSESKPSEDNSSESKPSETKPSESKPSEEKPSESSTVTPPEDKPGNGGNSSSDASSFTGGNISLDNIGISIPTLDKFNNAGLKENDYWWGGKEGNLGIIDGNAGAIMDATGFGTGNSAGNGFTITEYYIEWAYASYSAVNDISLHRDTTNGYYVLEINTPLDVNYSGAAGGGDISPVSRDIVKFMLSCVTSNVQTVYSNIYQDIYGDVCISDSGWTTLGDCKVQFDYNSSSQGHFVYKIKAK